MARTHNQVKGDMAEEDAKFSARCWRNQEVNDNFPSNNKGFDFEERDAPDIFQSDWDW